MEFTNKTCIITGGASGMGFLAGQCFSENGANIVLADIDEAALEKKAEQICKNGGKCIGTICDVRDYTQVLHTRDAAVKAFGSVDILLNCAGGASTRVLNCQQKEFKDIPIEIFDWGIDVNFKGTFYFCHAVMQQMAKQKNGVILNFGSITGEEGCERNIDYSACKSGVMYGMTKSLALYGARYNVRVCCISPGPVLTRPGMAAMKTLLGRAAQPQEIVDLALYLASDKAAFITGENILIDGGRNLLRNKE